MLRPRPVLLALAMALAAVAGGATGQAAAQATVQTQSIDPFGQEIVLAEKPIVYLTGTGDWDTAYETLLESFKKLKAFLDKEGIATTGPAMTVYTDISDVTFSFQAAMPVAEPPKGPLGDFLSGLSPAGKALKFVHRGSFDAMTQTYDTISHHVEEKQVAARDLLIEEYVSDIITTPVDDLVINIFVPIE